MVPSFFGGGVERMRLNLAQGFLDKGFGVDLVVGRNSGPLAKAVPAGVRLVDLEASRMRYALFAAVRYLKRARPDAVIVAQEHMGIVALLALRLAGLRIPVVVSSHIHQSREIAGARGDIWLPRFFGWLARRSGVVVVAVSGGLAAEMMRTMRLPEERIHVIYNPVVTPGLLRMAQEPCPDEWLAVGGPFVILAVGQLIRLKGHHHLIAAMDKVRRRHDVRLIILGEGPERANLERDIARRRLSGWVRLPGYVPNPYSYMARCRLLVLPSEHEALPGVLIEALACGTPVVATESPGGTAEILAGGRYGRLVPVGDVNALASAIEMSIQEAPSPRHPCGRAEEFRVDKVVDQYLLALGLEQWNHDKASMGA